ncbi:type IV pilus secretin PilQ [Thermovibrio sp.]
MVKRSLLMLGALTSIAYAGQVSSVDFLYTTESIGGTLKGVLEVDIETKGKCSVAPIEKEGREIVVELKNCKLPRTYSISKRGGFVEGAVLRPEGENSLFEIELTKPGTLKVRERGSKIELKVIEGIYYKPNFSVVKTVRGEELVVELPKGQKPTFSKIGNKIVIKVPNTLLETKRVMPVSQFVKEIRVKNLKGSGVIEVSLSDRVGATEINAKGNSLFITFYGQLSRNTERPSVEAKSPLIALKFTNADVRAVVRAIANIAKVNVVFDPEVKGKVNVDFRKPIPWKDALKAVLEPLNLTYIQTPEYIRILPKSKLVKEEKLEPVKTYIISLNYIDAKDIIKDIKGLIKSDARETIELNRDTNSLILKVTPTHYRQIREIVAKLDKPLKQVLVKAKIVQISTRAEKDLGFTWYISGYNRLGDSTDSTYLASTYGFNTTNYTPLITPDTYMKLSNMPVLDNTLALGILNKSQTLRVELALKAMELDGDAQIISSPKVLTLDNQEASIEQGIEIPYTEATVGAGGATSYNINFKKASLILKVKPHITRDGKIILDLEVRKDSPNYDYVTLTGSNEPAINTRNVKSKVIISNGSTVVIGGIYEKEKSKTTTGVPILSRIPLLGWLFKNTNTTVNKTQLLIFITPTLVNPEGKENLGGNSGKF